MNVVVPDREHVTETLSAALDDLSTAELREHIAIAAGLLAHREGDGHAFDVLCRIAGALGGTRGRA
jgi:hypothetical protein